MRNMSRARSHTTRKTELLSTHGEIKKCLKDQNALPLQPLAKTILEVMDDLHWHYSGYDDGRIAADVALRMQTCELIGPNGMIEHDLCRIGLFAQTANTDYVIRNHAAEELFLQIAGNGEWIKGEDGQYQTKKAGDFMHHRSFEDHASRTTDEAIIAAWIWTGDIDYKKYYYNNANKGDK